MTTKELNERQIWWSELLAQFDFNIEFRPGIESGKQDALTRREGDWPDKDDESITQKKRTLLPEQYFDNPHINEMDTVSFQETEDPALKEKICQDEGIQTIRKALDQGQREL